MTVTFLCRLFLQWLGERILALRYCNYYILQLDVTEVHSFFTGLTSDDFISMKWLSFLQACNLYLLEVYLI